MHVCVGGIEGRKMKSFCWESNYICRSWLYRINWRFIEPCLMHEQPLSFCLSTTEWEDMPRKEESSPSCGVCLSFLCGLLYPPIVWITRSINRFFYHSSSSSFADWGRGQSWQRWDPPVHPVLAGSAPEESRGLCPVRGADAGLWSLPASRWNVLPEPEETCPRVHRGECQQHFIGQTMARRYSLSLCHLFDCVKGKGITYWSPSPSSPPSSVTENGFIVVARIMSFSSRQTDRHGRRLGGPDSIYFGSDD